MQSHHAASTGFYHRNQLYKPLYFMYSECSTNMHSLTMHISNTTSCVTYLFNSLFSTPACSPKPLRQ